MGNGIYYSPGVQSTAGESIGQGIGNMGRNALSLLGFLTQQSEKHDLEQKTIANQGKSADAWYNSLGDNGPKVTGITPEAWKNLGSTDKWSAFQGVTAAQATTNVLMQQAAEQRKAQAAQALMEAIRQGSQPTYNGITGKQNNPADSLLAAIGANPQAAVGPEGQALLLKLLDQSGQQNPNFVQDPKTGFRYAQMGKVLSPSGIDPEFLAKGLSAQPITDPQGNVIGYGTVGPRGQLAFPPTGSEALNEQRNVNAAVDAQKALGQVNEQIDMWNYQKAQADAGVERPSTPGQKYAQPDPKVLEGLKAQAEYFQNVIKKQTPSGGGRAQAPQSGSDEPVRVIAPTGLRGSIPRSQLAAALKAGYKQVQ